MFVICEAFAYPISAAFVGHDAELLKMTVRAFMIYSTAYLFMGTVVFSSALFTALGNGEISAVISVLRSLVFGLGAVLFIPLIWSIDGIWVSVAIAEFMAAAVGIFFMIIFRKKYQY